MFLLYRVHGSKRNENGYDKEIVEDGLTTVDEAREIAWESGPGRYFVFALSRPAGSRVVERINVPSHPFDEAVSSSIEFSRNYHP